jgi:hypothetical protein
MSIFDLGNTNYPKRWADMSVEYKLMFAYHASMMVMMLLSRSPLLTVPIELGVAGALVLGFAVVSIRRRRHLGWHWPGIRPSHLARAVVTAALIGCFLYAATPLAPPFSPVMLPWYLAGAGLGFFGVLHAFKLVFLAEADFLANGKVPGAPIIPQAIMAEAAWKKAVRATFSIVFVLCWLAGVAFFYTYSTAIRDASPVRTDIQSELIKVHGRDVYVTKAEKNLIDDLQRARFGLPVLVICGFAIHFVLGVRLFPNLKTLAEMRADRALKPGQ